VAELVGTDVAAVGHAAFAAGLELHELAAHGVGLEDVFLRLTAPAPAHGAHAAPAPAGAPASAPTDAPAGGAR
jgi:ABC-2 type transport system ATP-binding protein